MLYFCWENAEATSIARIFFRKHTKNVNTFVILFCCGHLHVSLKQALKKGFALKTSQVDLMNPSLQWLKLGKS